ncbi:hypothetical protein OUZ56_023120 [Daphnia magna]|uniref:Uncharacterized protein n=1 Tax=Daphnia magna TaxID=35525 RepID=A0ABR0AYD1_9CRUS|nr:hypothetical protein OUZ56_023120 [Daphnia magna]
MNVAWKFTASATTQFPADLLCKYVKTLLITSQIFVRRIPAYLEREKVLFTKSKSSGICCSNNRGKQRHQYQYRVCPTFAPEKKIETVVKKEDIVLKPIFSEANYTDDDGSWACEKKILCSRKGKMKTSFLYYSLGAPSPKENNLVYRLER